jgi:nitrogen regulatory protein PII
MKISKVTCIVHRDLSSPVTAALADARILHSAVQSGRSVVLRERKRLFGLTSTTVLEDDPVDIYRIYVKPRSSDALLALLGAKADLATPGRGTVYCQDVDIESVPVRFVNPGNVTRPAAAPTPVSDLMGICCIVQRGQAGPVIRSILESGSVPTITFGEGMGVRDKLGLMRIAIPAEKEIVNAVVTRYDAEQVMNILIDVGRLDQPGKGFIYLYPIRKGFINTKTHRGQRAQGASTEQIVAAIDHLKGSSEWRKMEAVVSASGPRRYLRDLTNFSLLTNDGRAMDIVQAAMSMGAPGATISRYRQNAQRPNAPSIAREMSDIIVGRSQLDQLRQTVREAGLFHEEASGLIEKETVPLACTYLGAK